MIVSPLDPDAPRERPWTLRAPLRWAGVGLHGGEPAGVTARPAAAGTGLRFELAGRPVPASAAAARPTPLCTTLEAEGAIVRTPEHLLAALAGMGISDALLALDGPEVPILDGSALPFARAIAEAGVRVLEGRRPVLPLPALAVDAAGGARVSGEPGPGRRLTVAVDYARPPHAGAQAIELELTPASFLELLAPARTFGFLEDVEAMRRAGLARGGSLENAVVVGPEGPLTPLRFPDELVRHKALDLVGDLALLGVDWRGHVRAERAGHALHGRFCLAALRAGRESLHA